MIFNNKGNEYVLVKNYVFINNDYLYRAIILRIKRKKITKWIYNFFENEIKLQKCYKKLCFSNQFNNSLPLYVPFVILNK